MIRFALLAVAVGVSLVPGRVVAQDDTTEVWGRVKTPATVLPFEKGTAQLLLFKYNPNNLDEPAQRVSQFEIKDIKHEKEKVTEKEFKFGKEGRLDPAAGYYVTTYIFQDGKRTHIGELPGGVGLVRVLTDEKPRSRIEIIIREVRR